MGKHPTGSEEPSPLGGNHEREHDDPHADPVAGRRRIGPLLLCRAQFGNCEDWPQQWWLRGRWPVAGGGVFQHQHRGTVATVQLMAQHDDYTTVMIEVGQDTARRLSEAGSAAARGEGIAEDDPRFASYVAGHRSGLLESAYLATGGSAWSGILAGRPRVNRYRRSINAHARCRLSQTHRSWPRRRWAPCRR